MQLASDTLVQGYQTGFRSNTVRLSQLLVRTTEDIWSTSILIASFRLWLMGPTEMSTRIGSATWAHLGLTL